MSIACPAFSAPLPQASENILQESWQAYKTHFIQADGRVVDHSNADITTSEGQAYAMLKALWINDQATFDLVWTWAKANLDYEKSGLFAWKWGKQCDGTWSILDKQAATDADQDIAFALICASKQWKRTDLLDPAKNILKNIWDQEVVLVNSKPYLLPGQWAKSTPKIRLNPSYFAPYEYRVFAKVDSSRDWQSLVDTSYDVLEQCGKISKLGLPPDWCDLDQATGIVSFDPANPSSDYSYDAMRVPWRISLDYIWNQDPRAKKYLGTLSFLEDTWNTMRTIRGAYTAQGVMRSFDEPLAGFACAMASFQITAPPLVKQVLRERILAKYEDGLWMPNNDYYAQNWCWFGIALVKGAIIAPSL
jgi:endoglucanase